MTRYGAQFGPDITFLGVDPVDLDDTEALAAADVVVVGAPWDGGTSHRPGTRFGPQAIRQTDYLPHDGSRPHLALRVDALQDLRVLDAGDVEMPPGEQERSRQNLEDAVYAVASQGTIPLVLGGDHSITLPDATGGGPAPRLRQGVDDPLRRPRRHRRHRVRLALRPRPADAAADRVRGAARRPVPPDGAARLLARPRDAGLDGRAGHALLRDDRDRQARARPPASTRRSRSRSTSATRSSSPSTSTSATPATRPAPARPSPAGCRARELLDAVRRICRELPVAGIDVVEVSPPYDHAEITAFLANRVCLEALSGLAATKVGITHDPAGPLLEGR